MLWPFPGCRHQVTLTATDEDRLVNLHKYDTGTMISRQACSDARYTVPHSTASITRLWASDVKRSGKGLARRRQPQCHHGFRHTSSFQQLGRLGATARCVMLLIMTVLSLQARRSSSKQVKNCT